MLAKLVDFILCRFTSFITGVRAQKNVEQQQSGKNRLYYANHNSHGCRCLMLSAKIHARSQAQIIG